MLKVSLVLLSLAVILRNLPVIFTFIKVRKNFVFSKQHKLLTQETPLVNSVVDWVLSSQEGYFPFRI